MKQETVGTTALAVALGAGALLSAASLSKRVIGGAAAFGLVGGLLAVGATTGPTVSAAPTAIASDLTSSGSLNLTSFTNPFAGAFTNPADGFQKYQRGVSPTIPFSVLDDTLVSFPPDTQGIVDDNDVGSGPPWPDWSPRPRWWPPGRSPTRSAPRARSRAATRSRADRTGRSR